MEKNKKHRFPSELNYKDKLNEDFTNNNLNKSNRPNKNKYLNTTNERNIYSNNKEELSNQNKFSHKKFISDLNNNQFGKDKIDYYQFNKEMQMKNENRIKDDNNQNNIKLGYIRFKSKNNKNNIEKNNQSNTEDLNEKINELKEENLILKTQNQILNVSLIQKEQIIESLDIQIKNLEKKLKSNKSTNIDEKINNNEDNLKDIINKLKLENNELSEQNNKLTLGINSFNERIKEISEIYSKKNEMFVNEINSYKNKLSEYKTKIILLKKKIDELYNTKNINNINNNHIREPQIISLFNYNKDYQVNNQMDDLLYKNKNLTPNRISNKGKGDDYRKKRDESQKILKYNRDEKEKILQNEENNFVQNYKMFLNNLDI